MEDVRRIYIVTDNDLSNNLKMPTVVIGLIGTNLDAPGEGAERWNRWRPTISLCQHDELLIDRLELLHQEKDSDLIESVRDDLRSVSPETEYGHINSKSGSLGLRRGFRRTA